MTVSSKKRSPIELQAIARTALVLGSLSDLPKDQQIAVLADLQQQITDKIAELQQ